MTDSWTDAEIAEVRRKLTACWSSRQIAVHLKRSIGSVNKLRDVLRRQDGTASPRVHVHATPPTSTAPRAVGEVWTGRSEIKAVQLANGVSVPFVTLLHSHLETARPRTSAPILSGKAATLVASGS